MRNIDPGVIGNGRDLQLLGHPLRHVDLGIGKERVRQEQNVVWPGPPVAHNEIGDEVVAVLREGIVVADGE